MLELAFLVLTALPLAPPQEDLVERFLWATTLAEREAAAALVQASGVSFEAVYEQLAGGRAYTAEVERGRLLREREGLGGRHPYMILVPEDYDPARRWPVRMDLHGGMGAKEWKRLDGAWSPGWKSAHDQIVIVPAGWWDSMWWEASQVENLEAILAEVKRAWNVDEDRVVMFGGSDGCAALYFHAFRNPDRWAGYAGLVGPPDRLVRAEMRPDGQMHLSNLAGQRFLLGFGERDPKVPLEHLERYMELFAEHGALLDWYVLAGQGHSFQLPQERENELGRFLWRTVRDPLPERLSWATEQTGRYARRSWLVLDELAPPAPDVPVEESNLLPRWGTPLQLKGPTVERRPWGRVELERDGNTVRATTRGVRRFRLLISPAEFDLTQPIEVLVDGRTVFQDRVEPSLDVLLHWASRDDDRRLLFAAEIALGG